MEVGGPGCVDGVEVVVRRDGVDVRVQPLVGRRRWCGQGRRTGSDEKCCDEDACDERYPVIGAGSAERTHRTPGEFSERERTNRCPPPCDMGWSCQGLKISFFKRLGAMQS